MKLHLSDRQLKVLELLAEGFTNKQIADKLFVSKRTAEGNRLELIRLTESENTA